MAVATATALGAGCGPTDRAELERRVQTLVALAAEGRILADGVAGDRTRATFTRVHARTLAEDAQHEAEKLADADVVRGLRREREEAVAIAQRLSDALASLQTYPGGEDQARDARAAILEARRQAEALDGRIG
jgi:hypothetical protein